MVDGQLTQHTLTLRFPNPSLWTHAQPLLVYELAAAAAASGPAAAFATLADRLAPPPPPPDTGAVDWRAAAPPPPPQPPQPPILSWRDRVRVGYEVAAAVAHLHAQTPPLFCRV